ncbi:MAG: phosphoethanolamine transferase [Muribaculum sp.]|nr:phosphoethanolamine transferase [Muribaculum sp.]
MKIQDIATWCSSAKSRLIWYVLFIASVMGMADIVSANIFKYAIPLWIRWSGFIFCSAMKATLLIGVLFLCRGKRWLRLLASIAIGIYILLCLINFVSFAFYDFGISHKMLMLMSETNPSETMDFFDTFFEKTCDFLSAGTLVCIAGICVMYVMIRMLPGKVFMIATSVMTIIGACFFIFFAASASYGRNSLSMLLRTAKNVVEVYRENRQINSMMQKMQTYVNYDKVQSEHKAFNMIVIFGESADQSHLSLYGYPLPTTPCLDTMSDSLYVFRDVLASSKFTSDNMERMLTLKKDSDSDGWWRHPMLIDIMNAAGYQTFWLSNQERTGIWSNATAVMSSRAGSVKYIGKTSSEDHLLQKYDADLIPELEKALSDTVNPKWIGLHLMGSHFAYRNRYPEDRQHFSSTDIMQRRPREWMNRSKYETAADYDNSIRYTDSVVGRIFDIVAHQKQPSVVIYLSDHGENVFDDRDYNGRDLKHVRIPFVLYANDAYRHLNPGVMRNVEKSLSRKATSADLPHAVLSLTGTDAPEYSPTSDFLSPEYKAGVRYVGNEPWPYESNSE